MITLGINQFFKNFKRNALVIIQLIIVYIVAIFTVSAWVEQYSLFYGMTDYLDDTGMVVLYKYNFAYSMDFEKELIKFEQVDYAIGTNTIMNHCSYELYATNPDKRHYKMPLIEGEWCESGQPEAGVIRVVVSDQFNYDYKLGEVIQVGHLKLKIMGVYDSEELVYRENGHTLDKSYLEWYSYEPGSGYEYEYTYHIMASWEDVIRESEEYICGSVFIDFKDDITDDELDANERILSSEYGFSGSWNIDRTDELYNHSVELLKYKLLPMTLLLIIMTIFAAISIITSSAITVLFEQRSYGIYFICGNNWKQTFHLSLVHWEMAALTALIISVCSCVMVKITGRFNAFSLEFTRYHIITILVITFILLLIAMIMPYKLLKKMQPINVVKNNMEN